MKESEPTKHNIRIMISVTLGHVNVVTSPLSLARAGGRVDAPPMSFLEWPPNRWGDRAEILHSLWDIFCTTL